MNYPRYIVATTFKSRTQTKAWDSREPMMLGQTDQGPLWVMERTGEGKVRIRSMSGLNEVSNAHSEYLTEAQASEGVRLKFKKKDREEISLEIKAISSMNIIEHRIKGDSFQYGFTAFRTVGTWNQEISGKLRSFKGDFENKPAFSIAVEGEKAILSAKMDGLDWVHGGKVKALAVGESIELAAEVFFRGVLRVKYEFWYFSPSADSHREPMFEVPQESNDQDLFKKSVLLTLLIFFLVFGLAKLMSSAPKEEEVIPPQVVKLLIKKKEPKPVAKIKQELPEDKVQDSKEKPLAQSQETSEVKPNELIVPKGGEQKKSPSIPKPEPSRKIVRVKNLTAGIMKGGLAKLLDSKQLLNTTKLMTTKSLTGNSKALSGLSAGVGSLSMNLKGVGDKDTKISGFGGNTFAGVKGSPQIGYSDGVKGSLSGSGASQIRFGTEDADVEEGLTREEVGAVIKQHAKEIRLCYEDGKRRSDRVDGHLKLSFTINKIGRVIAVNRLPSSEGEGPDAPVGQCVMNRLRGWGFPKPKGGVDVKVSYPFVFRTLGGR